MINQVRTADKATVFWLVALLACAPWTLAYWQALWRLEHYRFFPFAFLATAWLIHSRWDRKANLPDNWISWLMIVAGVMFLCLGTYASSPWLGAVGGVGLLFAFCCGHRDKETNQRLTSAGLPMLLTLRLPIGYDQIITLRLQELTTRLSSVTLDILGISHAAANNTIRLAHRELFVAEACSGVQSVFTLLFLSVTLVAIYRRSLFTVPLYLLVAVAMAVVANVFRVSLIVAADSWLQIDLAGGWQHELVGYLALGLGIAGLFSFDHLVGTLAHPIEVRHEQTNPILAFWRYLVERPAERPESLTSTATSNGGNRRSVTQLAAYSLIGVCGLLAFLSSVQAARLRITESMDRYTGDGVYAFYGSAKRIFKPSPEMFADRFSLLTISEYQTSSQDNNPRLGAHADIWSARLGKNDSAQCQIVLSQPYTEWHELCFCYEIADWVLLSRESVNDSGNDESGEIVDSAEQNESPEHNLDADFVFARLKRNNGQWGYVFYTAIDTHGRAVDPPPMAGGVSGRLNTLFGDDSPANGSQDELMMLQFFVVANEKITPTTINAIKRDFRTARKLIGHEVVGNEDDGS